MMLSLSPVTSLAMPSLHPPYLACAGLAPCHRPLALALPAPSLHLHCCHCCRATPISLPSPLTYVPCIGCVLSCYPCRRWHQPCNSYPSASAMLLPMPSLHVLLLPPLPNAAAAILNLHPTPPPNATALPPSFNATATPPPSSNTIHVDCCVLIIYL